MTNDVVPHIVLVLPKGGPESKIARRHNSRQSPLSYWVVKVILVAVRASEGLHPFWLISSVDVCLHLWLLLVIRCCWLHSFHLSTVVRLRLHCLPDRHNLYDLCFGFRGCDGLAVLVVSDVALDGRIGRIGDLLMT